MGYFYTNDELTQWRTRKVSGPYKTFGADYTNSPGDWDRITSDASTFLNSDYPSGMIWSGMTQRVDQYQEPGFPIGQVNDPISGSGNALKYTRMMEAAFVDLVNETTTYRAAIKDVLLTQAVQSGVDYSNTNLYPTTAWSIDENIVFTFCEWMIKLMKAYDYVGEENFTAGEQATMRGWFDDFAAWNYYLLHTRRWPAIYSNRDGNVGNYIFTTTGQGTLDPPFRYASTLPENRMSAGSRKNNRSVLQTVAIVMAGIMLNNANYKQEGSWCTKEYVAYHWYPEGYFMEMYRSTPSYPQGACNYGPATLSGYLEIAKLLKEDGYEDLFVWTTTVGLNISAGTVNTNVGVTKSLEWCVLQLRNNFLLSSSTPVYPFGSTGTSTDILIHYCNATAGSSQTRHRSKPAQPASIANIFYDNTEIREIYRPDGGEGNLCVLPSNPLGNGIFHAYTGTGGTFAGFPFMYADITLEATPPTPSVASHTKRFRRFS